MVRKTKSDEILFSNLCAMSEVGVFGYR